VAHGQAVGEVVTTSELSSPVNVILPSGVKTASTCACDEEEDTDGEEFDGVTP
jgi:hypothetical protein